MAAVCEMRMAEVERASWGMADQPQPWWPCMAAMHLHGMRICTRLNLHTLSSVQSRDTVCPTCSCLCEWYMDPQQ